MTYFIPSKTQIFGSLFTLFLSFTTIAQVGIGNTSPNANSLLEIGNGTDTKGVLLPRVSLTGTNNPSPLSVDVEGMIVYNTNTNGTGATAVSSGFYFNNGSDWVRLANNDDWKLTGNAGTVAGTNFIGTTDSQNLIFKTDGSENMRIITDGRVSINNNAPIAGDRFTVTGASDEYTINGYASGAAGVGVYGENIANGDGVVGSSSTGAGTVGVSNDTGVLGLTVSDGYGVYGYADNANAKAGRMRNLNATGISMVVTGQAQPYLAYIGGAATFSGTNGLYSVGTDDGLLVAGNSMVPTSIDGNIIGVSSVSEDIGVFASANDTSGTGVIGMGNGITGATTIVGGSGLAGTGTKYGVYGNSTESTSNPGNGVIGSAGGYFANGHGGFAAVAAWADPPGGGDNDQNFKIFGTGTVSTIVKDVNENPVIMYAPEAPECLFQDYGIGELINGLAVITLDPNLSKNIRVDQERPLKVFIQLEGDCKGVFVTNKSANGFTVKELQGGKNNVPFSWSIVATRADEVFYNNRGEARVSHNSHRFPLAPPPLEIITAETQKVKAEKESNNIEEKSLISNYKK